MPLIVIVGLEELVAVALLEVAARISGPDADVTAARDARMHATVHVLFMVQVLCYSLVRTGCPNWQEHGQAELRKLKDERKRMAGGDGQGSKSNMAHLLIF